jgi:hypothetical protein
MCNLSKLSGFWTRQESSYLRFYKRCGDAKSNLKTRYHRNQSNLSFWLSDSSDQLILFHSTIQPQNSFLHKLCSITVMF